jgi:hypothetical protein
MKIKAREDVFENYSAHATEIFPPNSNSILCHFISYTLTYFCFGFISIYYKLQKSKLSDQQDDFCNWKLFAAHTHHVIKKAIAGL